MGIKVGHYGDDQAELPRRYDGSLLALLLVLLWAPLPLGSNRPWSLALLCAVVMLLAGIIALRYVVSPCGIPDSLRRCRLPVTILVIWGILPLTQLAPIMRALPFLAGLDVGAAYQGLTPFNDEFAIYLSIDRDATVRALLKQSTLVALFILVLFLIDRRPRLKLLLAVMMMAGAAQALYGLLLYLGGSETGLWSPGHSGDALTGTYVNQNHFAGLLELTLPVGLGLAFGFLTSTNTSSGLRGGLRVMLGQLLGEQALILFGVFIMLSALILTGSRGAIGSLAVGITITLVLGYRSRPARVAGLRTGLLLTGMAAGALLWFGSGALGDKVDRLADARDRADLRATSYQIIARNPVMGTGAGTFQWVFPAFKDERFGSGYYEHAHNDFLELLIEQGVIGSSLFWLPVVLLMVRIAHAYRRHHDSLSRGAMFASLAGCTSLLVHGLVDFNLQIPANAAYFFCLLAAGATASALPSPHPEVSARSRTMELPGSRGPVKLIHQLSDRRTSIGTGSL